LKTPWVLLHQMYVRDFQTPHAGLSDHAKLVLTDHPINLVGEVIELQLPEKPAPLVVPEPDPIFKPDHALIAKVTQALDLNLIAQAYRITPLRLLAEIRDESLPIELREISQEKLAVLADGIPNL
jgi:hypothetical protein